VALIKFKEEPKCMLEIKVKLKTTIKIILDRILYDFNDRKSDSKFKNRIQLE
jgi:hypothetical protein